MNRLLLIPLALGVGYLGGVAYVGAHLRGARDALTRKLDRAWLEATLATPLDDLCETGGKDLCFATNLQLDGPDW